MCYFTITNITPSWTSDSGLWISPVHITFPASFITAPKVLLQIMDGLVSSRGSFIGEVSSTTTGALAYARAVSSNNTTVFDVAYLAIGRWK